VPLRTLRKRDKKLLTKQDNKLRELWAICSNRHLILTKVLQIPFKGRPRKVKKRPSRLENKLIKEQRKLWDKPRTRQNKPMTLLQRTLLVATTRERTEEWYLIQNFRIRIIRVLELLRKQKKQVISILDENLE